MTARVAAPAVSAPRHAVPAGACDAHGHVFDARFPNGPSPYPLPLADLAAHAAMRATLGLARGVLVQPAPYGRDPACLLDALARSGGALRGVMSADADVTDAELESWHAAGVRGLRFVEMRAPGGGGRYPGSIGVEALHALAPRMRALGWSAHLWAAAAQLRDLLPDLVALRLPLVVDHLGMPAGPDDPDAGVLAGHLRHDDVWVKLTPCRLRAPEGYDRLRPLHDRLVAANPDRLLWGSDWPYVRMEPAPDAGAMLDLALGWLGDAALARRVLVDNPARLFGFDDGKE
ncbi:amidohydrolase family protein [Falsiroseomonas sp. CW058]|uniref:amidohydrolase family protein n=1 Tax=Falsiroseomonas sp. CW058 TaxID=3388664 RepID=UPI003D31059C